MNTFQIKTKQITWEHIVKPKKKEIDHLKNTYNFHPLDLEDCLVKVQRPQISEYANYVFFILTFPVYNRARHEIESAEIDFFVGSNFLITISDGSIKVVDDFFNEVKNNSQSKEKYMTTRHPVFLLYEVLHRLQSYTLPMLDHISREIEDIENRIFKGEEKKIVIEILHTKRNIVDFRRIVQAHKNIIKKLMNMNTKFFMPNKLNIYFSNILDRTKDIWDILETQKENINAFQETNESLISYKLNDIMKTLTIISVIMIPANLVASIFGMNTDNAPTTNFHVVLSTMLMMMLIFLIYFRKKKWL